MIIDGLARSYRWQPSEIFSLTDTQLAMLSHAAWASNARFEEEQRRSRLCEWCGEETVNSTNGVCSSCNRGQSHKTAKIKASRDIIEWNGVVYEGDDDPNGLSAIQKFKKADPRGFIKYHFGDGGGGMAGVDTQVKAFLHPT